MSNGFSRGPYRGGAPKKLDTKCEMHPTWCRLGRYHGSCLTMEPCTYCGKPCNALAGDPGEWPLLFSDDDSGVAKPHHVRCVQERVEALLDLHQKLPLLRLVVHHSAMATPNKVLRNVLLNIERRLKDLAP